MENVVNGRENNYPHPVVFASPTAVKVSIGRFQTFIHFIFTCSRSSMKSITADTETRQISKRLPCKAEDWENNHKQVRVCLWVRSMAWIITFSTERQFPDKIPIRFSPRPLRINFFLLDYMALSWKPYTLALKPTSGQPKKWMLIIFAFLTDNMRWVRKKWNKIKDSEHQDLLQRVWLI